MNAVTSFLDVISQRHETTFEQRSWRHLNGYPWEKVLCVVCNDESNWNFTVSKRIIQHTDKHYRILNQMLKTCQNFFNFRQDVLHPLAKLHWYRFYDVDCSLYILQCLCIWMRREGTLMINLLLSLRKERWYNQMDTDGYLLLCVAPSHNKPVPADQRHRVQILLHLLEQPTKLSTVCENIYIIRNSMEWYHEAKAF